MEDKEIVNMDNPPIGSTCDDTVFGGQTKIMTDNKILEEFDIECSIIGIELKKRKRLKDFISKALDEQKLNLCNKFKQIIYDSDISSNDYKIIEKELDDIIK